MPGGVERGEKQKVGGPADRQGSRIVHTPENARRGAESASVRKTTAAPAVDPNSPSHRKQKLIAIGVCAGLLILFSIAARLASLGKCATADEPLHLTGAWAQTHYDDFRSNPEDPPLWKFYAVAGTNPDGLKLDFQSKEWNALLGDTAPSVYFVDKTLYRTPGTDPDAVLQAARARMILLAAVLGALIAWWAWRLGGPVAAVVATTAFCLDPNFLAHAPLVKNDVAISLAFVGLMAMVWLLGERATPWRWLGMSLFLGVAFTTKFSGVLAIPMLGAALLCRALIPQPWPVLRWTAATFPRRIASAVALGAAALAVGYACIWACYGFRFNAGPAPSDHFDLSDHSKIEQTCVLFESLLKHRAPPSTDVHLIMHWMDDWRPDAVVRTVFWALDHRLLPDAWLVGFRYTYGTSRSREAFLCGDFSLLGWWYYFPAAMAFKTPLATLAGLGLGLFVCLWLYRPGAGGWRRVWALCAAAVAPVLYLAFAMKSNLNLGLRHVLPVYPYLYIFLGVAAAAAYRRRPKITAGMLSALALALVVETYCAYPDFIPFFNAAAGGERGGLYLLSDSNIDWGQDLPLLQQWQKDHPDRTIFLQYFGAAEPAYYGFQHVAPFFNTLLPYTHPASVPGAVFAISATSLQATYLPQARKLYAPMMHLKPIAVLGGSIYLFDWPQTNSPPAGSSPSARPD